MAVCDKPSLLRRQPSAPVRPLTGRDKSVFVLMTVSSTRAPESSAERLPTARRVPSRPSTWEAFPPFTNSSRGDLQFLSSSPLLSPSAQVSRSAHAWRSARRLQATPLDRQFPVLLRGHIERFGGGVRWA